MNTHWGSLGLSILLIFSGSLKLITGQDGVYWGAPVFAWAAWIFLPLGIVILLLSIRALLRGEDKPTVPKTYTDEDLAQVEAKMDTMYLREHGELPEKPGKDTQSP